jgi:rhodanese-related sulfurtransferase
MVAEAKGRIENLSVAETAAELSRGEAVLVDLREPQEMAQHGVIPGATIARREEVERWADPSSPEFRPEFGPERRIIFHCAGGARSALAADALQQRGHTNVAHLEEGFMGWKAAGRPVEVFKGAERFER